MRWDNTALSDITTKANSKRCPQLLEIHIRKALGTHIVRATLRTQLEVTFEVRMLTFLALSALRSNEAQDHDCLIEKYKCKKRK